MGKGRAVFVIALVLIVAGCVTSEPALVNDGPTPIPQAGGRGDPASPTPAMVLPTAVPRAEPQARAVPAPAAFPYAVQSEWLPSSPNRDTGRNGAPVRYIVIHYTAISYERTLKAFSLPASRVSAHYVVRRDGHVAQMVGEADTAWHAGNYWYNERSIGIEIELDPVTNPTFTAQQYYATAALACAIAARHDIPLDRAHVVGHNEIPGTGKIDPGPTWGWPHFMWLTSLCAPPNAQTVHASWVGQSAFPDVVVGETASVSVTLRNTGATAWRRGTSQEARLGVRGNDTALAPLVADKWPTADRPAAQAEDIVPPGGSGTFTFAVKGTKPGTFTIPLRGVVDGGAWMDDLGMFVTVTVHDRSDRGGALRN